MQMFFILSLSLGGLLSLSSYNRFHHHFTGFALFCSVLSIVICCLRPDLSSKPAGRRCCCRSTGQTDGRKTDWSRLGSLWRLPHTMLFCSLAVLDPRVDHTMDVLSPFIPVLRHSDWLFHGESCPRLDVVHPGRAWPSRLRAPGIVPCTISFSRQLPCFFMVWSQYANFFALTVSNSSFFTPVLWRTHSPDIYHTDRSTTIRSVLLHYCIHDV